MEPTLILWSDGYAKYDMGESKNTGEPWKAEVFRVDSPEGNYGLANGWYWYCQADFDSGVFKDDPSPHAGFWGPFGSEAEALLNADGMGAK